MISMAMAAEGNGSRRLLIVFLLNTILFGALASGDAASFNFSNACAHPVWVGALNGATSPPLSRTGFYLASGATSSLAAPSSGAWSGNFWARTGCATEASLRRPLVDGFNVPLRIAPSNEGCHAAACAGDVNAVCPTDLRVISASGDGAVVAYKSACNAYGSARYCCSGDYGTPAGCGPTNYSHVFKSACPAAYSYAYDDASSTFTCSGAAVYDVTFCPAT
ncbi:unnamed protein product [Alopecurus aequalis]